MTIPDCTLVTSCFVLTKYNGLSRNMESTIENMTALLEVPCYLMIYIDEVTFPLVKQKRDEEFGLGHLTYYVVMNVEELNTFRFQEKVHANRKEYHPTKDERTCPESHLVCSSKFELVLNAMERDPFHTTKFGWIDSNVGKNFSKIATNYTNNMLLRVLHGCHSDMFHLQILNVVDKELSKDERLREYYSSYQWLVCGCLFITGKEVGTPILQDLNAVFEDHTLKGYGHGEEMFYLTILDKYYPQIKKSYGDYKHILNNFLGLSAEGQPYINYIAESYLNRGYHRECLDCCDYAITAYEKGDAPIDYRLYFLFLFKKYVSLFYLDREKAVEIAQKTLQVTTENRDSREMYLEKKDFYDSQFRFVGIEIGPKETTAQ